MCRHVCFIVFGGEEYGPYKTEREAKFFVGRRRPVFLHKDPVAESGLLPKGGIARFYGAAKIQTSGPVYEEIWERLVQSEKDRGPQKKGFSVLIKVDRAEEDGKPLDIK